MVCLTWLSVPKLPRESDKTWHEIESRQIFGLSQVRQFFIGNGSCLKKRIHFRRWQTTSRHLKNTFWETILQKLYFVHLNPDLPLWLDWTVVCIGSCKLWILKSQCVNEQIHRNTRSCALFGLLSFSTWWCLAQPCGAGVTLTACVIVTAPRFVSCR